MIDISGCKKVSQDKNHAVFKHPDGHEVKVAVTGLSAAMKKKLASLPLHQAEGDDFIQPIDTAMEQPVATAEAPAQGSTPQEVAPTEPQQQPPAMSAPQATMKAEMPMEAVPSLPPPTADQRAQKKLAEDMAFSDDLKFQRIAPKTYKDLFQDKSTLGKLGTIFGLLIGGAGSGLTGQPDAMLHMMDKEIERDMERQKADQTNKQNWFKAQLEHDKNEADNALTLAHAAGAGAEADFNIYRNEQAGIKNMSATNAALNKQHVAKIQEFQSLIDKMSPGPQRDNTQFYQDNYVIPHTLAMGYKRHLDTEQKKDLVAAAAPAQPTQAKTKSNQSPTNKPVAPGAMQDAYDRSKYAKMAAKGRLMGDKAGVAKDAIPVNQQGEVDTEIKALETNRKLYADATKAFNDLANMENAGQAPGVAIAGKTVSGIIGSLPFLSGNSVGHAAQSIEEAMTQERNSKIETLVGQLAPTMGVEQARRAVQGYMPMFADIGNKKVLDSKFEQLQNHFMHMPAEVAPKLHNFGLFREAPKYEFKFNPKEVTKRAPTGANTSPAQSGKNKE